MNWIKQTPGIIFLLLYTIAYTQNDVVKDREASTYNLNKQEREEWLRL